MKTIVDLLDKWPTDADFARDTGIDGRHVAMMKLRDSIPPKYWASIVKAAAKRGVKGVSIDNLAKITLTRLKASA